MKAGEADDEAGDGMWARGPLATTAPCSTVPMSLQAKASYLWRKTTWWLQKPGLPGDPYPWHTEKAEFSLVTMMAKALPRGSACEIPIQNPGSETLVPQA